MNFTNVSILIIILLNIVNKKSVKSANILAITHSISPSHHIWNRALLIALAKRGHNVTYFGPDKEKTAIANLHHIYIEDVYEKHDVDLIELFNQDNDGFRLVYKTYAWMELTCQSELQTKGFQTLKNYPSGAFDLIIMDLFGPECYYPFVQKFGSPPVVGTSPYGHQPWSTYLTGDYEYPALVPVSGELTNRMTFFDRFMNFLYSYYALYYRKYHYLPKMEQLSKQYFDNDITPFSETDKKYSIILVNSDPIADYPRPTVPAVIPCAGLQIQPAGPIPENIKSFLDEADHGFILFSLGTNLRSKYMTNEKRKAIINAFKQIPQRILWKWENDSLADQPKNVMIQKWLPAQGNILAHPKIRLFITHGGALSTQEALYHGVPVIIIPFFADQFMNANKMVERGYGLRLNYEMLTTVTFTETINEVINNQKYKSNIMMGSILFKDQPQPPLERAVFWTEYVLRHGDAHHLQSPALHMTAYQAMSLDVVTLLFLICIIALITPFWAYKISSKKNKGKIKTR